MEVWSCFFCYGSRLMEEFLVTGFLEFLSEMLRFGLSGT